MDMAFSTKYNCSDEISNSRAEAGKKIRIPYVDE